MSDQFDQFSTLAIKSQEQGKELMEKFLTVSQADAVFSHPVTASDHTVITAAEVSAAGGFGAGTGGGLDTASSGEDEPGSVEGGAGGGSGGGGVFVGRPVAAIIIGPQGVRVEPIVDPTKIVLALLTTLGSMFFMLNRMRRSHRK
jgi:uncharacterized spore protein YtfJ